MKKLDLQHDDIKYTGKANKGTKRFLVTAAVAGAPVHKAFLETCEYWCKKNKAELVILSCRSHAQAFEGQAPLFDKILDEYFVDGKMVREFKINSNLKIIDAQHNPQCLNPQNGLYKFGNGDKKVSVINAHPSQNAITIASNNAGHPRRVIHTGACTVPNYRKNTIGRLAEQHHIIGAVIVEVKNDKIFFVYQIQARSDGSFYFNSKLVSTKNIQKVPKTCIVLGDLHPELQSKDAIKASIEQIKFFKPSIIVLHDWIDNLIVNPHDRNSVFKKALLQAWDITSAIKTCEEAFRLLRAAAPTAELVFVDSNHGNRLDRYIESGEYTKDFINFKFLHEAVLSKFNNPTESIYKFIFKVDGKTRFLRRREDYYFANHNLALHGDKGMAGKAGNLETFNRYLGKCIVGHSHSPGIVGHAKQVGHNSLPDHGYNDTLNNWAHGNMVLYEDGSYSELISVNGEWRL